MKSDPSYLERYKFLEHKLPSLYYLFIVTCLVSVVVFGLWAALCEIDIVVRAQSVIRPFANISIVKNATAGTVAHKSYQNGQQVEAGALLWRIDTEATLLDLNNSVTQLARIDYDIIQQRIYSESLEADRNLVAALYAEAYNRAVVFFSSKKSLEVHVATKRQKWEKEISLPPTMTNSEKILDLKSDLDLATFDLKKNVAAEKVRVLTETKELLTN